MPFAVTGAYPCGGGLRAPQMHPRRPHLRRCPGEDRRLWLQQAGREAGA